MSWETIYTVEDFGEGTAGVFNETSFTGHLVLQVQSLDAANFYKDLMNEVYNQVKKDVEEGRIVMKNEETK